MAERYHGYSKSKSSRSLRDKEPIISKERKSRHKHHHMESKTPPLPTKSNPSIEELLQRRKSLKEELKKIEKHTSNELHKRRFSFNSEKTRKHINSSHTQKRSKKRYYVDHDNEADMKKRKQSESSPENNDYSIQLESEDEESIIAQRRKQRKELVEKLNGSREELLHGVKMAIDITLNKNKSYCNATTEHMSTSADKKSTDMKKVTDMFSDKDDFASNNVPDHVTQDNENSKQLIDNWDDAEGYYNVRVGDIINNNRYTVKSILGQGVFANVVRAQDINQGNAEVAIKIIRNNDMMYNTGLKEIAILKEINHSDPENRYHCVKFLHNFVHKGHLCVVLESLHMDLRCVLKKYGKSHGLNMKAIISYSRQLLLALKLLKKIGIIHADIKPDNILVNEKKNILKLCDFGSATKVDDNSPTPYLVSRFYRAPEIILGISYRHSVDIWSTACTMYEMATGKIMFTGSSNNKMLKCFMDLKGKIPSRLLRKGKFKDQHFNYNNNFLLHKKDNATGREKVVEICNINVARDLHKELKKCCKQLTSGEEKKLLHLKELLDKMTTLDPKQRLSIVDCLKHPFIQEEVQK